MNCVGAIKNSKMIAESVKLRNELVENKTALLAYRCDKLETTENLTYHTVHLRLICKERLHALRQRLSDGAELGSPRQCVDCDRASMGSNLSSHVPANSYSACENGDEDKGRAHTPF